MVAVGVSVVHIPRKRQYGTQRLCVPAQLELKDWTSLSSMRRRNIPLIYNKTQTIIQPLIKTSSPCRAFSNRLVILGNIPIQLQSSTLVTIGHRQMVLIFLIRLIAKHEPACSALTFPFRQFSNAYTTIKTQFSSFELGISHMVHLLLHAHLACFYANYIKCN